MRFGIFKFDEVIGDIAGGRIVLIESIGDLGLRLALHFLKNADRVSAIIPKRLKRDLARILKNARILTPNEDFTLHELFTISLATKKLDGVILLDILQILLIIHAPEKVYQLFQEVCDIVREKEGIMLTSIDKKLVEERVLAMFENEADYVIEIEEIVDNLRIRRGIRVKKNPNAPPSKFYELIVDERGIRLGEIFD